MDSRQLPPFAALRAFAAVGRLGGFRKAAAALGISHAIVSRHISGLEQHLGTTLIDRGTGTLTVAGKAYHSRIFAAIAEMEAATRAARASHGEQLRIWCSAGFALHWLTRRLPAFGGRAEGIMVDLHSTDAEPALLQDEADGEIRYRHDRPDEDRRRGVRMIELARPAVYPVASPQLLARLPGAINSADDLLRCPLIEEVNAMEWTLWFLAQSVSPGALSAPVARYGQAHLTLAAARAGQGIALSNDFLAAEDLAEHRLVKVSPGAGRFVEVAMGAYVFRGAQVRWNEPALARFRTWLRAEIARDTT